MKIWQIEIGTEDGGENIDVVNGLAENAQEAIKKGMDFARAKDGCNYENPYPSRVTEIGEQVF